MEHEQDYANSFKPLEPMRGMAAHSQNRDAYTPQASNGGDSMYISQSNFTSRQTRILNDLLNDKLKALTSDMRNAAHSNDLDKANKLKKSVDKTMKLAKLAKNLEFKKVMAIDNEDYDTAKILKVEIDKVKKSLMSVSDLPSVRGSSMSNRSIATPQSDHSLTADDMMNPNRQMLRSISQIEHDLSRVQVNLEKPNPSNYMSAHHSRQNTHDSNAQAPTFNTQQYANQQMRPASHETNGRMQASYVETQPGQQPGYQQEQYGYPQQEYQPESQQFDEQVIPMANKSQIDFTTVKDEAKGKADPQKGGEGEEEKLSNQNQAKVDIMKQYFDQDTVKLMFSKKWQNRKKGFEQFIQQFPKSFQEHGVVAQEHGINMFFISCKENLAQLSELCLQLFVVLIKDSKSNANKTNEMIVEVLDKKALDITKDVILAGGNLDFNTMANFIMSDKSYKNKRLASSDAHIPFRMELMSFMIDSPDEKSTSKKSFPLKEIINYVFDKMSHANKDVRKKAQDIVIQIYQKSGWYALESHISRDVPQNQLQYLVKEIPEVDALIKKKDGNKGSESLREALKAVKEANQSVQNVPEPKKDTKKIKKEPLKGVKNPAKKK